jgi:glyoxylate/hydroxypyruvate reductase A
MSDRAPVILFAAKTERWQAYEAPLRRALAEAGLGHARLTTEAAPGEVDYVVYAPNSGLTDFTPMTRLKAVLNLWAGVEDVTGNPTLKAPLARMVDEGLTEGMVEWVTGHVLRHHLGMDAHIHGQDGVWRAGSTTPLARDRTVAILGLGVLGAACAQALAGLNFRVRGWSRSARKIAGVETASGAEGLDAVLADAEIVVLLLPDTPETENTLDARTIALLPRGAVVINPGRGPLIDDDALLAALDSGHLGHATLDVFRTEPLPPDHPYWAHPKVTVTPHIASETRAASASRVIAENIRRGEAGEPFLHLVDRDAGY